MTGAAKAWLVAAAVSGFVGAAFTHWDDTKQMIMVIWGWVLP